MNSILTKIAEDKKQEVSLAKKRIPIDELIAKDKPRDFVGALKQKDISIIAEIKKASPSKGIIREDFDVKTIAQIYEKHKAACLSVLTDISYFQGHPDYLMMAKETTCLPILRKDFIIDPYQIYESRALGADCILLIVALLSEHQLKEYSQLADELGMAVLVESHDLAELEQALKATKTPLIGINNRSLHNFHTDLNTSIQLSQFIPNDKIIITESGINHRKDILFMQEHQIHTFLIGESLMRSPDIGSKLDELLGH